MINVTKNDFVSVSVYPVAHTQYAINTAFTAQAYPTALLSEAKKRFTDPLDQKAWEAYKRIEPRYSDANRMLAK
ncbi:MAG: hypothetical protein ACR2H5_07665 [Ktedonobacteraceae bacterium]